MAKNVIRTSKDLASEAGKALKKPGVSKTEKSLAGGALSNRRPSSKKK